MTFCEALSNTCILETLIGTYVISDLFGTPSVSPQTDLDVHLTVVTSTSFISGNISILLGNSNCIRKKLNNLLDITQAKSQIHTF